ncbi:HAMP domain-containing sensor histidine kinase [Pseudodesulfovibrio sp.]|uniref:sensor histidine kinase n=1 Tax=Pseudodesulfovibrio sp. TaxID=2035812 RepID=UPI0026051E4E|nr:HAMP domain-containing sensor histidine kinase [Pseudodesulfovibrio sp.]MDD3313025.1 HAMP domain-containing sensor histidine kinase [Pseudodesulfovibrio sp.]
MSNFCQYPRQAAPSRLRPSSLACKILAPVLLVMLVTCLSLLGLYSQRMRQQGLDALQNQLAAFTASKAEELTEPVWNFQNQFVKRLMRSYRDNQDLYRISLYNYKGELVAMESGAGDQPHSVILREDKPLTRTIDGEIFNVGRLIVEYHDGRIQRELRSRRQSDVMLMLALVLVLGATTWGLLHVMVGNPLDRLKASLSKNTLPGNRTPLVWKSRDELGQVVTAYNTLLYEVEQQTENLVSVNQALQLEISNRRQAEARLARAHDELEDKVAQRTRELKAANERLLELDKQRSAFLSSASHELRTPLAAILGFSVLVKKNFSRHFMPAADTPSLEKKGQVILSNLEIIAMEGDRLTRLINDLLDLNKIEAGRMEWRDTLLNVGDEIKRAVKTMDSTFAQRSQVAVTTDIKPGIPPLSCDPDRFQQLLLNLLSNAAKHTARGGISIEAGLDDAGLGIVVADTGNGIPPEHLDAIFDKFFQSDGSDTHKPSGTGLGLPICKQIVEHYHGSIRVESEVGRGSRFIITLPVRA